MRKEREADGLGDPKAGKPCHQGGTKAGRRRRTGAPGPILTRLRSPHLPIAIPVAAVHLVLGAWKAGRSPGKSELGKGGMTDRRAEVT